MTEVAHLFPGMRASVGSAYNACREIPCNACLVTFTHLGYSTGFVTWMCTSVSPSSPRLHVALQCAGRMMTRNDSCHLCSPGLWIRDGLDTVLDEGSAPWSYCSCHSSNGFVLNVSGALEALGVI